MKAEAEQLIERSVTLSTLQLMEKPEQRIRSEACKNEILLLRRLNDYINRQIARVRDYQQLKEMKEAVVEAWIWRHFQRNSKKNSDFIFTLSTPSPQKR